MARTKGMLNLSGNLEVNAGAPLDARSVVPTVADLTVAANFQYKYVGMTVVVQATGDMYILTANDVTVAANWKQVGSGGGGSSYTAGDGIVIDNDEISTDNMPAADMSEIVTPLPSVMSRLHTYSEEEKIVAYWEETVNGVKVRKPVYEKCINFGSLPNNTSKTYNIQSLNIDRTIVLFGFAMNPSNGSMRPIPFVSGSVNDNIRIGVNQRNTIDINTYTSWTGYSEVFIIINYTKTTD